MHRARNGVKENMYSDACQRLASQFANIFEVDAGKVQEVMEDAYVRIWKGNFNAASDCDLTQETLDDVWLRSKEEEYGQARMQRFLDLISVTLG